MSREVTIRLPQEIGAWVRRQPGSCTETVLKLAGGLWEGRRSLSVRDPGPGEDRLKVRLSARALRFIREATHSRDATTALRKLLLWGYEGRALSASPSVSRSLPVSKPIVGAAIVRSPAPLVPRASPQLLRSSAGHVIEFGSDGQPLLGDATLSISPVVADLVPSRATADAPLGPLSPLGWILRLIPERAFTAIVTIAVPLGFLLVLCFFGRWVTGLDSVGKLAGSAGPTGMRVAPTIATWEPQAATGLGVLFA
jgi:hypothetical protein